jgi:hypothetical protein
MQGAERQARIVLDRACSEVFNVSPWCLVSDGVNQQFLPACIYWLIYFILSSICNVHARWVWNSNIHFAGCPCMWRHVITDCHLHLSYDLCI